MDSNRRGLATFLIALGLAAVTLATFWPATGNDFINFDDQVYLTLNPAVKNGLTWESVRYAFTTGDVGNWHPITWLSHLLDVQLYGFKNPGGHHRTSVLIHAANAALLFILLQSLTRARWPSAFVAATFALHPLRVESVAWASERKDLLCAFFGFLALLAYCRYVRLKAVTAPRRRWWFGAALLFHAFSLMSKPMLVTLPCLLLLLDFWPLQRFAKPGKTGEFGNLRALVIEKIPFFALTFVSSIVAVIAQSGAGAVVTMQSIPLDLRIINSLVTYMLYLGKIFWPTNLAPFYPYPLRRPDSLIAMSVLILVGVSIVAWVGRKKHPYLFTGWFWYLGLMVPVIGLLQVGSQSMADRYTYLPSIGIMIAAAWGLNALLPDVKALKPLIAAAAALLLGWWSDLAMVQVLRWRNSETIFNHTLSVTKENAIAQESLGLVLAERGSVRQAEWHFAEAVRIWPKFSDAYSDYGLTLSLQGKFPQALENCQKAVDLNPNSERFLYNLARTYTRMGSNDVAQAEYERLLKIHPNSRPATLALADLLMIQGKNSAAVSQLTRLSEQLPNDSEVLRALSYALIADNRKDDAIKALKNAVAINPNDAAARGRLGIVLIEERRPTEAVQSLEAAARLSPAVEYQLSLAETYATINSNKLAIQCYEKCVELQPAAPATLNNLAWMLATVPESNLRNGKRAVQLAERACRLTGDKEPFYLGTLAAAYAEAGQFPDAIRAAQQAVDLARAAGQEKTVKQNSELLELYQKGQPFHEEPPH